jgi:hypothetical protein
MYPVCLAKPNGWEVCTSATMAGRNGNGNVIDKVEATSDTLTSRGGVTLFV